MHPKGGRFATGGQGGDSGRVVVWNLAPVLSEKAEKDASVPKMLCQMDNHLGRALFLTVISITCPTYFNSLLVFCTITIK